MSTSGPPKRDSVMSNLTISYKEYERENADYNTQCLTPISTIKTAVKEGKQENGNLQEKDKMNENEGEGGRKNIRHRKQENSIQL